MLKGTVEKIIIHIVKKYWYYKKTYMKNIIYTEKQIKF